MSTKAQEIPIYDSAQHRSTVIEEFLALIKYRDLLVQLVSRNLKARYKRSALGICWTLLNPLMMMIVLTVVFSSVFQSATGHYAVYALSGLIVWNFFAQTTASAMSELLWGGALLHRIYVPRVIFAMTALGTGLINLLIALLPLAVIMLLSGAPLRPSLLFLPVPILLTSMFALGVALFLSTLAVYFSDVLDMFQILLMGWMYLTPVIYPVEIIPDQYRWLMSLNPMYYLLAVFRAPIYSGQLADLQTLGIASLVATLTLAFGWWFFTRKADEFAYRI